MARPGNRDAILEAARKVVQDHGVTGLTFDALARESGITRAGVIYHFGSRDKLLADTQAHLAGVFECRLHAELTVPFEQSTQQDRLVAYVRTCATVTSRAELLFMLEAALDPSSSKIWTDLHRRWLPPTSRLRESGLDMNHFIVRVAADGLWLYEASTGESLTTEDRRRVADALIAIVIAPNAPD